MNREILKLAIPNIISNISVPLLSTVDTAIMGRFSEEHLGAIGLGSMIFNFIYWNFGFLRMGTTGITAQAYGAMDSKEMMATLGRALAIGMIIALLVLTLQFPLLSFGSQLLNVSGTQAPLVDEYFQVRIWAAPATLALYGLMGWFFGMQNAIYPLILTVFINAVNIAGNFIFVYHFGMEVDGIALATVIAQYAGLVLGLILFFIKYKHLVKTLNQKALLQLDKLKAFLIINRDIFIRTLCLTFAFGFFYNQSSSGGETILAINVILLQFVNWMAYGIDGFAFAAESLVGKYTGAKDPAKLRRSIKLSFFWGMAIAALFSLIYWVFDLELVTLFTNQEDLISATMPFIFWMILFPIVSSPCFIWDGIYIGLTASKAMRDAMLVSLAVYMIVHFSIYPAYGNHGLWAAFLIFMGSRGVFQYLWYRRIANTL